ncbi:MAG: amidotransferase [Acidobacteria bacterium]|nr:amidotransferase [Acidobacteriota bacterium]
MKIGLLLCDHVADKFENISGDYPEMFSNWINRCDPEIELVFYDAVNGRFPLSLDDCAGFMTTGSRYSVYDDKPWIHQLKSFILSLRQAGKPYAGICFGHQMLAEALGGKTLKSDYGWGISVRNIEIIEREPWMIPPKQSLNLQYMHQDQVVKLPEESVVLGRSRHCPVAAFRVGQTMLGIQAHPEFTADYSEALMRDRIHRIGEEMVLEGLEHVHDKTDEDFVAKWIIGFLSAEGV